MNYQIHIHEAPASMDLYKNIPFRVCDLLNSLVRRVFPHVAFNIPPSISGIEITNHYADLTKSFEASIGDIERIDPGLLTLWLDVFPEGTKFFVHDLANAKNTEFFFKTPATKNHVSLMAGLHKLNDMLRAHDEKINSDAERSKIPFEYHKIHIRGSAKVIEGNMRYCADLQTKNWHYYERDDGSMLHIPKDLLGVVEGSTYAEIKAKRKQIPKDI